jgi:hypothetical protein
VFALWALRPFAEAPAGERAIMAGFGRDGVGNLDAGGMSPFITLFASNAQSDLYFASLN